MGRFTWRFSMPVSRAPARASPARIAADQLCVSFNVGELEELVRLGLAATATEGVVGAQRSHKVQDHGSWPAGARGVSTMNWRRGLFRLWIVGTALFVLLVARFGGKPDKICSL